MKYFSIDLETTGLDWDNHQILEFGAIFEDTDNPKSYEDSEKLHVIFRHKQITGDPYALQMNNRLLRIIAGVDPLPEGCTFWTQSNYMEDVISNFLSLSFAPWAKKLLGEKTNFRVNVAGKNFAAFDLNFLRPHIDDSLPTGKLFNHRILDVGSMFANSGDVSLPNLTECLKRTGYDEPTDLHSALGDCWDVIRSVRGFFEDAWE